MPAHQSTPPAHASAGPGRRPRVLALLLALMVGLSACGLRLETPPPEPLVPDEIEAARQRTTADAVALGSLATVAATDPQAAAVAALTRVREVSELHVAALGGVYDWTPPAPVDEPSPAPEATASQAPPAAVADDVVAALEETAASARADAAAVPDPALARLLASIATARLLLADAVRGGPAETPPEPFEVPAELPAGTSPTLLAPLIQSEDALGMGWEVLAARSTADSRDPSTQRAASHRARAEAWALLAEVDGTGLDPRRSAYDLPDGLLDPAADGASMTVALTALEQELAASYASLVHAADPGARTPLVDALVDTARAGWPVTSAAPAFPGLPEQTD